MNAQQSLLALFPGQGSQRVGMGKSLYETSDIGRSLFETANSVLGFELSKICFEGPAERLTATEIAQPAVLTVSIIALELFKEKFGDKIKIVAAAGHSLGEYSALVAAGAISFEDAVALVHKRGKYMQDAVPLGKGKMIAVLGKSLKDIEPILSKIKGGICEIANINAPGQIILSGDTSGIEEFKALATNMKLKELEVSAPFHSSLMKPAELALKQDLEKLKVQDPAFPVYANWNGQPISKGDEIKRALEKQVCSQVRWIDCVTNAIKQHKIDCAVEFGEGRVITNMVKRITNDIECIPWDKW